MSCPGNRSQRWRLLWSEIDVYTVLAEVQSHRQRDTDGGVFGRLTILYLWLIQTVGIFLG